jgi:MoxR-like ATPase
MFDSLEELASKIAATGYFIDPVMTRIVFLAAKLQKPLLLEGPAGSGKTQLAVSVAQAAGTHIERLQCYRGVTEDKAIGRFDESLQRLYMEFSKGNGESGSWRELQANLKGRDFFRPGPLMRALECEKPCVLLIDELDKVDEGFEALLLEILSAWQLSIPEFGKEGKSLTADQLLIREYSLSTTRIEAGARADGVVVFDRPNFKQSTEKLFLQIAQADQVDRPILIRLPFTPPIASGAR